MHVTVWIDRLARADADARRRLEASLDALGPDASTVFTPLAGEDELLRAGVLTRPLRAAEAAWRADLTGILVPLGLHVPPGDEPAIDGRTSHSDAFRWLWGEFTTVRKLDPKAVW
jgi:1,2-phenylacetyl-CoA epoxidase catalytic subunit